MDDGPPISVDETGLLLGMQITASTQANGGFDDTVVVGSATVCGALLCLVGPVVLI